jgi:hypothetical protein
MKSGVWLAVVLMSLFCAGCGGSGGLVEVHGRISVDGKAVDEGTVDFLPADGKGPTAAAVIAAGEYKVRLTPGAKNVEIRGYKKVGEKRYQAGNPMSPMVPVLEDVIPKKYQQRGAIQCDIAPATAEQNFELAAKK